VNASKLVVSIVILFLFTPLSVLSQASINNGDTSIIHEYNSESSAGWVELKSPIASYYDITESSGLIHSPFGSFDPKIDFIPLGPENLFDPHSFMRTGMAIVQSKTSDMSLLTNYLENEPEVFIICYP